PLPTYRSIGQIAIATPKAGASLTGERFRLSPQASYFYGPVGLLGEWVRVVERATSGPAAAVLRNDAWQGAAVVVLTGEVASYGSRAPRTDRPAHHPSLGIIELEAR